MIFGNKESFLAAFQQNYEETQKPKSGNCNVCGILKNQLQDNGQMIQGVESCLSDKDRQIEEQKVSFEQIITGKDKQIEDLERIISEKAEVIKMKEEIINIQSKWIVELESCNEIERTKNSTEIS